MNRQQQQDRDARYNDWRAVYSEEIHQRVKHWGDKRKRAARVASVGQLDGNLFAPGGDND